MIKKMIIFRDLDKIKKFVKEAEKTNFNIDISHGNITVDGKSLIGILAMDLSRPVKGLFYADESQVTEFLQRVKSFIYVID